LAAKDCPESDSYKHILQAKGEEEVKKRRVFLEIDEMV